MAAAEPRALVVHGLTGTPHSVEGLAGALAGAGFSVALPLLPGHGTTPGDLESTGWDDWLGCVRREYEAAAAGGGPVVLAGLSMGASLVCRVACDRNPAAMVLVNPFVDPPAESFREMLRGLLGQGIDRLPGIAGDVADPDVVEQGYDELPVRPLLSLCTGLDDLLARLERIRCPLLLFTSRTDHVVPPVSSDILAGRVGGPVERVALERSHHVATLDHDRGDIERRAVEFALRHAGGGLRSQPVAGRLSRDDVLHVARLARLDLTDDEVERFTDQLAAVLEHAADVAALDTAGVPPTSHPIPLENVLRADEPAPTLDRDEVLAEAPESEGGRFRVPPILGPAP